ncbi:hypothetical protein BDQ12DRAFT_57315 [Crucibulum laeve]|uniref:Uncharacterized protein n=1 Tax=Crucibulum laeve TaxID=68775 RepID=A0A5C3ME95_9AGAR|nr:hypothetical protein BDQ12DRAFT_57315 [Crucibulum laeve]
MFCLACDATQSSITQSPPVTTNNTNDIVTSKPSLMSAIPAPAMGSMNSNVVCPVTENQANLPSHDPDQTTATNSSSSLQAYINAIPTPLMSPASRDLPSNSKTMVAPDTVSAVFAPPSSSPDPLDLFKYDWLNDPPPSVSRRRKLRMKKRTRFFGLRESPPEEIGDDELNMF